MKTLDASEVRANELDELDSMVKNLEPESPLAFFIACLSAAVRSGDDLILGKPTELVSPSQAAKLLGISRTHLYKVLDSGELPCVAVGRDRRISLGDVEALLRVRDEASKRMAEGFAHLDVARDKARAELDF